MHAQILIVDDDLAACEMIQLDLQTKGYTGVIATNGNLALGLMQKHPFDVVLTDLNMPGMNGIELCRTINQNWPETAVIVLTAFGSLDTAILAIRAGAYDFVTKPVEMELVAAAIERALRQQTLENKVRLLSEEVERTRGFGQFIGQSQVMQDLYTRLLKLAATDVPVLIVGDSGTGKELAARALHDKSPRSARPFVTVNCPALPDNLLESELFGHVSGAFTGASERRKGLFQQAGGGTLFLDEIGDFPLNLQPKLLRVLEDRRVRPVGGDEEIPVDVRVIAATNHDLVAAMHHNRFREELFYRINVVNLKMPTLRERGNDILLLAQYFLEQSARRWHKPVKGLSRSAADHLLAHNWPGNVRELRNAIEHAVALTQCDTLQLSDLPAVIKPEHRAIPGALPIPLTMADQPNLVTLQEAEDTYIRHVLETVAGNRSKAADILGIDRKTLYRKLHRHDR